MTDWFRSWHGAPTDPKWLGIAKRAGVAPGIAVAVGWALMDRASAAEDRGSVEGYDADGLGCFFGCEADQVDAIVAAMVGKGMIVAGRFSNWEKRQPKREDDSAQRVREHRKRIQEQAERDVTLGNAPEKKVETEVEDTPLAQQPMASRGRADLDRLETRLREAADLTGDPSPGLLSLSPILGLLDAGHDLDADVLPTIRELSKRARRKPRTWEYFTEAIRDASARRRGIAHSGLAPPDASSRGASKPLNLADRAGALARELGEVNVRPREGSSGVAALIPHLSGIPDG